MSAPTIDELWAPFKAETDELLSPDAAMLDANTHLGLDEDGRSLDAATLIGYLDLLSPTARAAVFPLHDPDRSPNYSVPNDRVLAWAAESDGRLIPYCRLDPAEQPAQEAERALGLGARGIKLHPRAQAFGFETPAARDIFSVAKEARVPILIHAGRGMPTMAGLAKLAQQFPEVSLVLAHAAVADQGIFASELQDHPSGLYDTSWMSPADLIGLFSRVPAERIVFASDPPYGFPNSGLYLAMRCAAYAGIDAAGRELIAGKTMGDLLDHGTLPEVTPPRLGGTRVVDSRLARVESDLAMALGAAFSNPTVPEFALGFLNLARASCRDPEPGNVGPELARLDELIGEIENWRGSAGGMTEESRDFMRLFMVALCLAGTHRVAPA